MAKSLVGKVVKVSWLDAWQSRDYITMAEAMELDGKSMESYGICIGDTNKGIAIAMDDLRLDNDDRFRDVKFILRSMVVKVKELR